MNILMLMTSLLKLTPRVHPLWLILVHKALHVAMMAVSDAHGMGVVGIHAAVVVPNITANTTGQIAKENMHQHPPILWPAHPIYRPLRPHVSVDMVASRSLQVNDVRRVPLQHLNQC